MHRAGVNLPDLHKRQQTAVTIRRADRLLEQLAIAPDIFVGIVRGEAEVERLTAVAGRDSALPGAEAVHQPAQLGQRFGAQNLHA